MTSLVKQLMLEHGITPIENATPDARSRLLTQADTMLSKLDAMKSDSELESKNSSQNWWSNKRKGNKRRVSMRYGGLVVIDGSTMADDTVDGVRGAVMMFRKAIEASTSAAWVEEEQRRKK